MRRTALRLSPTSSATWAADYLARVGLPPPQCPPLASPSAASSSHSSSSPATGGAAPSPTLSASDAAALATGFQAARDAFLGSLGVCAFPYSSLTGQTEAPTEVGGLRGLTYDDYAVLIGTRSSSNNTNTRGSCLESVGAAPSPSPVPAESAAAPAHWPTLRQLTKQTARYVAAQRQLRADTATSAESISPTSPTNTAASQLASLPYTLFSLLAEHAVRHAWRGGPHVYPHRRLPVSTDPFPLTACPRLRQKDVAGTQWERREAAHFLLAALRHPCVQTDLRQHLWAAAQGHHRDILHDLAALTEEKKGEDGEPFVSLRGGHTTAASTRVPLAVLQRDLFSFPEGVHYTPATTSQQQQQPHRDKNSVVLRPPNSSSHWFHFTSTNAAVLAVLGERPHTDVFLPTPSFAPVHGATSSVNTTTAAATATRVTTQGRLWLLLSEMVRLRLVVAHLLHLERLLFRLRAASTSPEDDVAAASAVEEVFAFLSLEPQSELHRVRHARRFLLRYDLQPSVPVEAQEKGESPRTFSTVQGLFNAFTRAPKKPADARAVDGSAGRSGTCTGGVSAPETASNEMVAGLTAEDSELLAFLGAAPAAQQVRKQ